MKDTPQNRKKLGISPNADVTWIDLDEQQKPPEMVTGGWTDTQIKGKSLQDIDGLLKQNQLALESMEKSLAEQRQVIYNLQQVRQRKLLIGD